MSKRAKTPDYRFPWCDVCDAHRKEVDGVRHRCEPKQREQMSFEWRGM